MTTSSNTTGKKTYRVWADHVRRMYQEVEAESPKQARKIARDRPECWEDCFECEDRDDYRVSHEVQDVETERSYRVDGATHCKTCGGEITEDVNDSHFHAGECGPCEWERYRASRAKTSATSVVPTGDESPPPGRVLTPERWAAARADSRWALDRLAAHMRERFERYPLLHLEEKIRLAMDVLWDVLDICPSEPLEYYPEDLPEFEEYLAQIAARLLSIRWSRPDHSHTDAHGSAA